MVPDRFWELGYESRNDLYLPEIDLPRRITSVIEAANAAEIFHQRRVNLLNDLEEIESPSPE
jgi:hypothetical protein